MSKTDKALHLFGSAAFIGVVIAIGIAASVPTPLKEVPQCECNTPLSISDEYTYAKDTKWITNPNYPILY